MSGRAYSLASLPEVDYELSFRYTHDIGAIALFVLIHRRSLAVLEFIVYWF